jgi:hypothetical protein
MKRILGIILICVAYTGHSQSAEELVSKLNWRSLTMDHQWHLFILNYKDTVVSQLISQGKPASTALLKRIKDPEKTVVIHTILTKIWEPENSNDALPILYEYENCDDLIGWYHIFNGLVWEWNKTINENIETSEIEKITTYWTQLVSNGRKVKLERDIEAISQSLTTKSESKFPCKRKYENNSKMLNADMLISLLNHKTQLSELTGLFSQLGNDSTKSYYKDCFFVSYNADGVDFRFNNDSTLTSIFIKEPFKGETPYQIKLSDKKDDVEKRFGKPSTVSKWSGNVSVSYQDKMLHMDFDKDGRMTNFYLSR